MNPFANTAREFPRVNRLLPSIVIPIGRAYFCLNCEIIHNSHRCPKCDKVESIPLLKWLGREEAC